MAFKLKIPKNISLPTATAWWACGELNSRRKAAKQRETDLIKTRKKLEDDLDQFGARKCAERTRVCELLVDTQRAIEATRNEIKWLADQMQDAFDHANQPGFWEDEDKLAEMLGAMPARTEPIDELIAAAADVRVRDGEVGGEEPRDAGHAHSALVPSSISMGDRVWVVRQDTGEKVAEGEFEAFLPGPGAATIKTRAGQPSKRFDLAQQQLAVIVAPGRDEPGIAGMLAGGEIVNGQTGEPAEKKTGKKRKSKSAS